MFSTRAKRENGNDLKIYIDLNTENAVQKTETSNDKHLLNYYLEQNLTLRILHTFLDPLNHQPVGFNGCLP